MFELKYRAFIPFPVLSPVGVNLTIVKDGENGYFAKTENDWFTLLDSLLTDENKRKQIAMNGRKRIIDAYSVQSQQTIYHNLFQKK